MDRASIVITQLVASALLMLLSSISQAGTQDIIRETTGYGNSYDEAVAQGLLEAVRQVRGLEVGTERSLTFSFRQMSSENSSQATAEQKVTSDVYTKSKGFVRSYEVLDVQPPNAESSLWRTSLRVVVPDYQSEMKGDTRKRIAVMPIQVPGRLHRSIKNAEGGRLDPKWVSQQLTDSLVMQLTQSRKFAVLNRQHAQEMQSEFALWNSDQVPAIEAARLGKVLAADFVLVGIVTALEKEQSTSEYYGITNTQVDVAISMTYRVVEVATQKVMWANTLAQSMQFEGANSGNLTERLGDNNGLTAQNSWLNFYKQVSGLVVTDILEVIYPIKVMKVASEHSIYLNQGGSRVAEGAIFDVFSPPQKIRDPDTGMFIQIDGEKVGSIQVTSVLPKYSLAKLISGNVGAVQEKAVVRKTTTTKQAKKRTMPESAGSSDKPFTWD
ncbi:MAG: hypothetical protein CMF25_05575 [Kangiellaceae bacterium]|nr:hypothetical protein [Kangiellaceae bacterium]|tara:strand:+ start:2127 stop:3446 length:1320 start_codon:yes stop_codon:yes gene_type:complete